MPYSRMAQHVVLDGTATAAGWGEEKRRKKDALKEEKFGSRPFDRCTLDVGNDPDLVSLPSPFSLSYASWAPCDTV